MESPEYKSYLERLVAERKFDTIESLMEYVLLKELWYESTEELKCDRWDYREISIATLKNVLDAVYLAGQMSMQR